MGVYVTDNEIDFFRNQVKIAEHLREVSKTKQKEIDDLKEQILTLQSQMSAMHEQMMHDDRRFSAIIDEKNDATEQLRELQKHYDKLDEGYDRLVDENYGLTCERDGVKRTCEAKDAYISNLQVQISDLVERNRELNDRVQGAIKARDIAFDEMDKLRKELKSALEALHDQYDESDKPCCKKCVHCRPYVGTTDCYCSQTGELIKNKHAETYYCNEMIPYEDDYPF